MERFTHLTDGRLSILVLCVLAWFAIGFACDRGDRQPPEEQEAHWDAAEHPWPMYGQNPRRTNRSPFVGPQTYTPASPLNWSYTATGGAAINMQATVTNDGVYFGTWGLLRRDDPQSDPDTWNKFDGRYYGLHLDNRGSDLAQEIFEPMEPYFNPYGYLYPGRDQMPRDVAQFGDDEDWILNYHNGTVEGTAVVDPQTNYQWFGRGDGGLYAVDPQTGALEASFKTFNPQDPDDPDGGGEVISPPLMGPDRTLYFASCAAPWPDQGGDNPTYETNAVYAVRPDGTLRWRYPKEEATLENWITTAPIISADGETMYVATFGVDTAERGRLLAFDLTVADDATDEERLKFSYEFVNPDRPVANPPIWVRFLAMGPDDTIFVGGQQTSAPMVLALRDTGETAELVWDSPAVVELQGYPSAPANWVAGLALWEENDTAVRLYASTAHPRGINGEGGALFVLDAATGEILAEFDPETLAVPGVGGMTGPTLDAQETCFVGVRGKHAPLLQDVVNGWMYAVSYNAAQGTFDLLWQKEVDGNLDWATPAIGPNGGLYFGSTDFLPPLAYPITFHAFDAEPARRNPIFYGIHE